MPDSPAVPRDGAVAPDLAESYTALQRMLLEGTDLVGFLHQVADLATSVVLPAGGSCVITMRRGGDMATIATSVMSAFDDQCAVRIEEIQYGVGDGPCLEVMRSGVSIRVDDVAAELRWPDFCRHAADWGVGSCLSVPLTVNDETLGVLNFYAQQPAAFGVVEVDRVEAFARQTAITLAIALRSFDRTVMEVQLREALTTRAIIDQAMGIIMGQRRIGSRESFDVLRTASQTANRPLRVIAGELVQATTGRPPDPPRPFVDRR